MVAMRSQSWRTTRTRERQRMAWTTSSRCSRVNRFATARLLSSARPQVDARRPDLAPPHLERDLRQWTPRRTGDGAPVLEVERALVAGTVEDALVPPGHPGAGEVRAPAREREEDVLLRPQEDADVLLLGIVEGQRTSHRNRGEGGDAPGGRLSAGAPHQVLDADPEVTGDEGQAGEGEEPGEV